MENEIVKKDETVVAIKQENKAERFANNFDFMPMLPGAGQVMITDKQMEILYAPVNMSDVEMRPDGMIYLPWREYQDRLRKAFRLEYALIPNGNPIVDKNSGNILWGFYLIIQGHMMAYAIGEQTYSNNSLMTWSDACEGAKSNALMRVCKDIGIATELWKPSFIREWKEKNLHRYEQYKNNKGNMVWRLKVKDTTPKFTEIKADEPVKKLTGEKVDIIPKDKVEQPTNEVIFPLDPVEQDKIRNCCFQYCYPLESLEKWMAKQSKGKINKIGELKIDQVDKILMAIPKLAGGVK